MNNNIINITKMSVLSFIFSLFVSCGGGGGSSSGGGGGGGDGTISNPLSLGVVDPLATRAGYVTAVGDSFYSFTANACGGMYTIGLTSTHSDLSWNLYSKSSFDIPNIVGWCDDYWTPGPNDEICQTNLVPNTKYYLSVSEYDGVAGNYTLTLTAPAPPAAPASEPTGVALTGGKGVAKIAWNSVSGATTYNIYWSLSSGVTTSNGNKIAGVTSPYLHTGLSAGTYYYIVTGVNLCSEGPSSAPTSTFVAAAGTPLLNVNFDDGTLMGFVSSSTGSAPATQWGVTNTSSHSGGYSATDSPAGNYSINNDTTLTSPTIDLTSSSLPVLSFFHRYTTEKAFDKGSVEISTDNGVTFTNITPLDSDGYSLFYSGTLSTFTPVAIDLSPYKSFNTVKIRFRLITDDTVVNDGWYIDDILVSP